MNGNKKQRFGIRKYSIGVASTLLSIMVFLGYSNSAEAAEGDNSATTLENSASNLSNDSLKGGLEDKNEQSQNDVKAEEENAEVQPEALIVKSDNKETKDSTSVHTNKDNIPSEVKSLIKDKKVIEPQENKEHVDTKEDKKALDPKVDKKQVEAVVVPVKADKSEKVLEDNKITQKTDSVNNDTVANKNETTVSQNLPASAAKLNLQNDETPINEPFGTDTGNSPVAVIPESSANNSLRNRDSAAQDSLRISTRAADNSEISVSSWNDLVTAVNNPNISKANITGNLNATSNLVIPANRMIEIDGGNLNLGSYQINPRNNSVTEFSNLKLTGDNKKGIVATDNSAVVSFNNVSHTGSDLVNAKNVDVVIKGDTNSTVTSAKERIGFNPEANIYAKNLEVAKDSSLTIDRNASQGDLIHLADGGKIEVKDNASLNATLDGQRRDAVVRVTNNGAFVTGAHSTVDLNTHNSRGIVLGQGLTGELPAGNSDSYAKSLINKNPSNELTLGNYTTFNFNGREAVLIGHNGKFNSGESSNITFNNKGDGVAFDMGDEGHFTVQPHAVLHLNSTGKKNSGNWEYSNYIGLDNNGQIRIEHDSEVYVDLKDRGTHPYNDTINVNSTKPGSKPYFYVGDNATLDV